jgi:hypothetical protein
VSSEPTGETEEAAVPTPENAAWAAVQIPLPGQQLLVFLSDIERLFRLNPHLEIAAWRKEPQGPGTHNYWLSALNEMNGCRSEVAIQSSSLGESTGYILAYDRGLKQSTELRIEAAAGGSLLTITERYHPVLDETDERLKEVDRSLIPWTAAIRRHLKGLARFGGLPGYRWWTESFMLGLPPRQRRIVRMTVWVSALEFVVFLCVALIFWLETRTS